MTTVFLIVIIFLWSWMIFEIMRAPCVDKDGNIIPKSSALDTFKEFIKTKIKW